MTSFAVSVHFGNCGKEDYEVLLIVVVVVVVVCRPIVDTPSLTMWLLVVNLYLPMF